jgi:predicted ATP-grasp superfamily ATP-dependent carboligase
LTNMPPILIICSIPVFTRNIVWAAGIAGYPCHVMTPQSDGYWRKRRNVVGVTVIDQSMLETIDGSLQQAVSTACSDLGIEIVVPGDTRSSRFLMRSMHLLPPSVRCFPMCESSLFEQLYDKWHFAVMLKALSLPHPTTCLVHANADVDSVHFDGPCIIKPTQGEGGKGIEITATPVDLHNNLRARQDLHENPVVVQPFIDGADIDLSLLADHGHCLAWSIQQKGGHGVMNFVDHPEVLALGRELVSQINYHGVLHVDMRIDQKTKKVLIIEANPRFWGSLEYSVWSGVNFLDLGLRLMNGADVTKNFVPPVTACPYLAVTRRSFPKLLTGGWPEPKGLNLPQRDAWYFHHRFWR